MEPARRATRSILWNITCRSLFIVVKAGHASSLQDSLSETIWVQSQKIRWFYWVAENDSLLQISCIVWFRKVIHRPQFWDSMMAMNWNAPGEERRGDVSWSIGGDDDEGSGGGQWRIKLIDCKEGIYWSMRRSSAEIRGKCKRKIWRETLSRSP